MRTSKYLLTADDYGAIDYIDQGIINVIRAGKINSVACFETRFERNGEMEFPERIQKLSDLKKADFKFSIGLHFFISAGFSNDVDTILYGNSLTKQNKGKKQCNFKWREIEFNTLIHTDIPTKPTHTVFRGSEEIDREKPVWLMNARK